MDLLKAHLSLENPDNISEISLIEKLNQEILQPKVSPFLKIHLLKNNDGLGQLQKQMVNQIDAIARELIQ